MQIEPPDPNLIIQNFIYIQREIFINICAHFSSNINEKNKSLFLRATEFSKDFNNCESFSFEKLMLTEEIFPIFCNFYFDFMNYIRKLDAPLYEDSINFARSQMTFPTMPTLNTAVLGCSISISAFLDMRENGQLPESNSFEDCE